MKKVLFISKHGKYWSNIALVQISLLLILGGVLTNFGLPIIIPAIFYVCGTLGLLIGLIVMWPVGEPLLSTEIENSSKKIKVIVDEKTKEYYIVFRKFWIWYFSEDGSYNSYNKEKILALAKSIREKSKSNYIEVKE